MEKSQEPVFAYEGIYAGSNRLTNLALKYLKNAELNSLLYLDLSTFTLIEVTIHFKKSQSNALYYVPSSPSKNAT